MSKALLGAGNIDLGRGGGVLNVLLGLGRSILNLSLAEVERVLNRVWRPLGV